MVSWKLSQVSKKRFEINPFYVTLTRERNLSPGQDGKFALHRPSCQEAPRQQSDHRANVIDTASYTKARGRAHRGESPYSSNIPRQTVGEPLTRVWCLLGKCETDGTGSASLSSILTTCRYAR